MKRIPVLLAATILSLLVLPAHAYSQLVPFDSDRWEIRAQESKVVDYLGRKTLFLKGGSAVVKDSRFTDGVIEFDIAFTPERGFCGVIWRMQDFQNYENFYLRPHQSGNPDANQYQPVFNGVDAWQLYYGDGYGAPVKYDFDQWVHIKLVVSGKNAEVFIRDMNTPALFVNQLKREIKSGRVGLDVGNFAPAYYSNFSFEPMSNPPTLKGKAQPPVQAPNGTVKSWMVSNTFDARSLERKYQLTSDDKSKLTSWDQLECESTGICNLARLHGLQTDRNTVFARITIRSASEQIKPMAFGFSDRVRIYLNDRLLYAGSDSYRSRDYRFLGTVGLFDKLYLPLQKGDNALWMAISEEFGGWGIKAQFEDLEGIEVLPALTSPAQPVAATTDQARRVRW
jgi:hypothetical protein